MQSTSGSPLPTAVPHLNRLAEFESVLAHYQVSANASQALQQTRFAVLLGPSSSGRNTIIARLVATGRYHFVISDTTRPPRFNNGVLEQSGVEYWFRDEDDMLADLKAGKYLEAEILHGQQVSGISIRELELAQAEHGIAITDIDIGGVHNVLRVKPDTAAILILPPSFEEWQRRIQSRGTMSPEEYRRRAKTALTILSAPFEHDFYQLVVNDELAQAVQQVDAIAQTGRAQPADQAKAMTVAEQLRARLRQELA